MARSIAEVSAKVTADATQFVAEFKRADNESRRSAARINSEVDRLTRGIKRKFSASDIGKSVLTGFGLGSGFAVAQTIADTVVKHWREAADASQAVEAASAAILRDTRALFALRQSPEQQLDAMSQQLAQLDADIEAKKKTLDGREWKETKNGVLILAPVQSADTIKAQAAIEIERSALNLQIEKARASLIDSDIKSLLADLESARRAATTRQDTLIADQAKARAEDFKEANGLLIDHAAIAAEVTAATEAQDASLESLAQRYAEMADPSLKYKTQLEEIDAVTKRFPERAEEMAKAAEKVRAAWVDEEMGDLVGDLSEASTLTEKSFKEVETAAEAFEAQMAMMWNNVSDRAGQAFADIVLTGKGSFADLADIVARSMIEIAARLTIINPILNLGLGILPGFTRLPSAWGGGGTPGPTSALPNVAGFTGTIGTTSTSLIPGHADGARMGAGDVSWVGERGRELFVADRPGTIVPFGESMAMAGAASGDTFNFSYNFAAGVQRSEILPMMKAQEEHTIARIRELRARGKM